MIRGEELGRLKTCYFSTHGWRRELSFEGAALEEEAPFEAARAAARALLLKKVDMVGMGGLDDVNRKVWSGELDFR